MPNFHTHVYFPAKVVHLDIEAPDAAHARSEALRLTDPDMKYDAILSDVTRIAMTWDENGIIRDTKGKVDGSE